MRAYLSNSISSVHAAVVVQELVCLALSISQLVVLQYFCVSLKPFTVGSSITFSHLLAFELWTLTFSHTSLGSPSNGCLNGIDFDAHSQANTLLFKVALLSCICVVVSQMTDRLWRYQTLCTMVSNMHVSQNWIISSMYYNCHYISKKQVHIRTCAEHNHTGNDDQNTHWKMSGIDYPADWGWQHRQPFTCKAGCFHLAALKLNVPSHVRILRRVRKAFARKTGEMAALS